MKNRLFPYIGVLIGCLGWIIGFAIVTILSGNIDVLLEFLFVGIIISLSFFMIIVVLIECLSKIYNRGNYVFWTSLWGIILFFTGILSLLISHWIAPIIEKYPDILDILIRMKSVYKVSDIVSGLILTSGLILLSISAIKLIKNKS